MPHSFARGRRTGEGVLIFPNQARYEGSFRDDECEYVALMIVCLRFILLAMLYFEMVSRSML